MNSFDLTMVTCVFCGGTQAPLRWVPDCPGCGNATYTVEIERSASGIDAALTSGGGMLGAFIEMATDDQPDAGVVYRTQSFLRCGDVTGKEIAAFTVAPVEERRRLYVSWKRREVELRLEGDLAICARCKVSFKIYDNAWNRAGPCSRVCHDAFLKSRPR